MRVITVLSQLKCITGIYLNHIQCIIYEKIRKYEYLQTWDITVSPTDISTFISLYTYLLICQGWTNIAVWFRTRTIFIVENNRTKTLLSSFAINWNTHTHTLCFMFKYTWNLWSFNWRSTRYIKVVLEKFFYKVKWWQWPRSFGAVSAKVENTHSQCLGFLLRQKRMVYIFSASLFQISVLAFSYFIFKTHNRNKTIYL